MRSKVVAPVRGISSTLTPRALYISPRTWKRLAILGSACMSAAVRPSANGSVRKIARNCSLKFRRASPFALPLNSRRCNALNCGNGCNTCPCQQAQPEPFSFSHFFLHFFSSFLSPSFFSLRISKRTMLCNTKDDAAHWLWKRWEAWLMPFS